MHEFTLDDLIKHKEFIDMHEDIAQERHKLAQSNSKTKGK